MRVLVLSDTHGALDERVAALAGRCDLVAHAGDVGAAGVLRRLRAACPRVVAVRGNNDVPAKWAAAERAELEALPEEAALDLPGGVLVIVHGDRFPPARRAARLRGASPAARAIAYGHTHRLGVDDAGRPWLLNPGAAGRARTHGGPSCLCLTATARRWRVEALRFPPPGAAGSGAVQP